MWSIITVCKVKYDWSNLNDEFNHMVMKWLSDEFLLLLKKPFVSKSYKKTKNLRIHLATNLEMFQVEIINNC